MKWIPILVCTHAQLCTGVPAEGPPQPTYWACQEAISRALDVYTADAHRLGIPEAGSYQFTRRFITKKCEPR